MRFSLSFILATTFVSQLSVQANSFSQGSVDLTRDYSIQYPTTKPNGFRSTNRFCTAFRGKCETVAGRIGLHHQLDCVFNQGNPVYAFCGGSPHSANGGTLHGAPVVDLTSQAVALLPGVQIVAQPLGAAGCAAFSQSHGGVDASGNAIVC